MQYNPFKRLRENKAYYTALFSLPFIGIGSIVVDLSYRLIAGVDKNGNLEDSSMLARAFRDVDESERFLLGPAPYTHKNVD